MIQNFNIFFTFFNFICENWMSLLGLVCGTIVTTNIMKYKKYFISRKSREFLCMGEHQEKKATPSMGGLAFYFILPIVYCFCKNSMHFWFIFISSGLSGLIGGIDDWYKIKYDKGLSIKIKFLLQMISALIAGVFFCYTMPSKTFINFFGYYLNLGNYYSIWIAWVIMATTHAVNLIDGIDGLAISQIIIIQLFSPIAIFFNKCSFIYMFFVNFFIVNKYKAKIFMGDIGAFFLGGYLASMFILAHCELLLIFSGIVFVINTVMVIIQFLNYRLYKTRFFLFTPYHHALEKKGWSENKICYVYSVITLLGNIISILLFCKYYK